MLDKIDLANRIAKLRERGAALEEQFAKEGDGGGSPGASASGAGASGPTPAAVHVDQAMGGGNNDKKGKKKVAKEEVKKDGNASCGAFVATIMHASTVLHIYHLQTRSYAEHVALGELYGALPGLIDGFAEACQGRYGLITGYPSTMTIPQGGSAVNYVRDLLSMVDGMRGSLPQDTELQNIVDEITSAITGTLYKLNFLS